MIVRMPILASLKSYLLALLVTGRVPLEIL
jgi:hypothetical protein